ncbi:hypothetical protein EBZ80_23485 [bacterium]|nr:hypothetical protein [bacterium]
MFDAGEVITFAIAFAVAGCGISDPQSCTCSTANTSTALTARLGAVELFIKPSLGHLVGASRPRTTSELSGLAVTLWLRSLAALLLAFGSGHAVGELSGLNRL